MSEKYEIGPSRYTVNADGLEADFHPVQVVARYSDSEQGYRAAFKRITKLLDEYRGEKFGVVLARYAPIGKVYTTYGVVRFRYESANAQRGWLNSHGDYVLAEPTIPFDAYESWCVVEFSFIDKGVSHAESHDGGGHTFASVYGCAACRQQRANAMRIEADADAPLTGDSVTRIETPSEDAYCDFNGGCDEFATHYNDDTRRCDRHPLT